jgi:hypothetical protein
MTAITEIDPAGFVGRFTLEDGGSFAVDRRSVVSIREEGPYCVAIGVMVAGQRPVLVACSFAEVHRWWTRPDLSHFPAHIRAAVEKELAEKDAALTPVRHNF